MDFSFYQEPPVLDTQLLLEVEALSSLSMANGQPGNYYQSQRAPTTHMLYGMLENALGWHFAEDVRKEIFKELQKVTKKKFRKDPEWAISDWLTALPELSGSKFFSFLQYHLTILPLNESIDVETYDDLWSQALRDSGRSFFGGSRHYDASLESIINRVRRKEIEFGDRSEFKDVAIEAINELPEGLKVNYRSIRPMFPQYYTSLPTTREYVNPQQPYCYTLSTTQQVKTILQAAIEDPEAPLYLGTNDGWVHLTLEEL